MTRIKGSRLLITGGASGIGRIMGRMALEREARQVVVWDINEQAMASTMEEFAKLGEAKAYKVDIADGESIKQGYAELKRECGEVDILINCAGIVRGNRTFEQQGEQDIELTMRINAIAPMLLSLQLLPDMMSRNRGHICNIASAAGMIANPKMSVYAASKWSVIGWSESVRIELQQKKSGVHITTVAPYYINTGMFDGVESRIFPLLKPEPTARKILRAIENNTDFKCMPWGYHFIRLCQGLLPSSWFDTIVGEWVGIYSTMDNFTGRKSKISE